MFSDKKKSRTGEMDPRDIFYTKVFLCIPQNLIVLLSKRSDWYKSLNTRFGIFRNIHEQSEDVMTHAKRLVQSYMEDIDKESFVQECQDLKYTCAYMKMQNITYVREIYSWIKKIIICKVPYLMKFRDCISIYLTLHSDSI